MSMIVLASDLAAFVAGKTIATVETTGNSDLGSAHQWRMCFTDGSSLLVEYSPGYVYSEWTSDTGAIYYTVEESRPPQEGETR